MTAAWLNAAVSTFGEDCKAQLDGPGEPEAAIRGPIETLIKTVADQFKLTAVPHAEVHDTERSVRPDYAIAVNGAITGYVEVKQPGLSVDPNSFTGHNKRQWDRLHDLPNLLYTNGVEWRLWKDGVAYGAPVYLTGGDLRAAGAALAAPDEFETLLRAFLDWKPATIRTVQALVKAVAPLTRLLRAEVVEQLDTEQRQIQQGADATVQPFTGLASDWRNMLFPQADDKTFSDGYAQTVTFALLLARTEDITFDQPLHEVGNALDSATHSIMGRALQLLTDHVAAGFKVTLDLLVRVVGAVDWTPIRARYSGGGAVEARRDAYLHLYEAFLNEYDPDLRKASGTYYTPRAVVTEMVRLTEEALHEELGKAQGFADASVFTVDPAMGTGTYVHTIIDRVADQVEAADGAGAVPAAIAALAQRLVGFELQMGPFAVAELRATDLLRARNATPPPEGMRFYVTDTLDDPHAEVQQLASGMALISQSRKRANQVKATTPVTVVIGNPPYAENAGGRGGWVEDGDGVTKGRHPILDDFRVPGDGVYMQNLKNLYVYFWRWGLWKVFDAPSSKGMPDSGIVCFISTSGYLRGPGFRGMRQYLRRTCSAGWIIDLTPEGLRPDVSTRIFPGVAQPLAIGLFVKKADNDPEVPATLRYRQVTGKQQDKFDQLSALTLSDDGWRPVRTDWQAPLTAAAEGDWDQYPAMDDLMPWSTPGSAANRKWVIAPSKDLLIARWKELITATDEPRKKELFKESRDATLHKTKAPLPGSDTETGTAKPIASETSLTPTVVRYGYRALDRQWAIADSRVWHAPRPPLWQARRSGQVFVVEQHAHRIRSGPGLVFSDLIPDMDYFKGSEGGRTLPLYQPGGRPNFAPGLLNALTALVSENAFDGEVSELDVLAYIAGVVAHPGYTAVFADQLTTPGIRVPITAQPNVFAQAVELGRAVLWVQTFGERFEDAQSGRPASDVRFPTDDARRIKQVSPMVGMPDDVTYDASTSTIRLGSASWGPVTAEVFQYEVGGKNVIRSWIAYRKKEPGGNKSSDLDRLHVKSWPGEWSAEFVELLSGLTRLVDLQAAQEALLKSVLAGPILSTATLAEHGVYWPETPADRRPSSEAPAAGPDSPKEAASTLF